MSSQAQIPPLPVLDASVRPQTTIPTTVSDPAIAEQQLNIVMSATREAKKQIKTIRRTVFRHRLRLRVVKAGIPAWVIALIAGSGCALLAATAMIVGFGIGLGSILVSVVLSYGIVGGGAFWFFQDAAGENDGNRLESRIKQLKTAQVSLDAAHAFAKEKQSNEMKARQLLDSIRAALSSDAHRRQVEMNRLLAVDPGRFYPDEFERFVGDVFRFLGFTVEVTGKSGDQGVDVLACRGQLRLAIQAKRYIGGVGNSAVQEVFAGMAYHKCHRCVVVTSGDFTSGAIALAQSTGCLLIALPQIPSLIRGEIQF